MEYRILNKEEIIQEGDEVEVSSSWNDPPEVGSYHMCWAKGPRPKLSGAQKV